MSGWLGIAIGESEVHAIVGRHGTVLWAGESAYHGLEELADTLARLAAEANPRPHRARVVLRRKLVQLRTILPAPPLRGSRLRRHVAIEAPRLFRNGQGPLVSDARVVRVGATRAAVVAAASEALVRAVVAGCDAAGLDLRALGPAAEVLPSALATPPREDVVAFSAPGGAESLELFGGGLLRSRWRPDGNESAVPVWAPTLEALGEKAPLFAAPFAATRRAPLLRLFPPEALARGDEQRRRSLRRLAWAAGVAWLLAGAVCFARLAMADLAAQRELARLHPSVERLIADRADLALAERAVGAVRDASARRSQVVLLLADLTRALGDSVVLASVRLAGDSVTHLAGYASSADGVIAALERTPGIAEAWMEAPVSRQSVAVPGGRARELDRFAIAAPLRRAP